MSREADAFDDAVERSTARSSVRSDEFGPLALLWRETHCSRRCFSSVGESCIDLADSSRDQGAVDGHRSDQIGEVGLSKTLSPGDGSTYPGPGHDLNSHPAHGVSESRPWMAREVLSWSHPAAASRVALLDGEEGGEIDALHADHGRS
jgi:hypothetical protein